MPFYAQKYRFKKDPMRIRAAWLLAGSPHIGRANQPESSNLTLDHALRRYDGSGHSVPRLTLTSGHICPRLKQSDRNNSPNKDNIRLKP